MKRIDHCSNLIHFTKGKNKSLDYESAYSNFKQIIIGGRLLANNGMILGMHNCVCFTESPARCLTNSGKLNSKYFSRYTPFGFQYTKVDVFGHGGRPVIYSTKEEYKTHRFNHNLNWRFVSYDPQYDGKLDFTWEREWRIKMESIPVKPEYTKLVFPNSEYIERFINDHEKNHHGLDEDDDCQDCYCTREATIINFTDFMNDEHCEELIGTCPDPDKFPWILINMNEQIE